MLPSCLLFVPGDRPERFAKAAASGAGGIIIDLEDAVAPEHKPRARESALAELRSTASTAAQRFVRINALRSRTGLEDLLALSDLKLDGVVVPKAASGGELAIVAALLPGAPIVALIESVAGIRAVDEIAHEPGVAAVAFGNADLSAELGSTMGWDALLAHRSRVILAARSAGIVAYDGVTLELKDARVIGEDARRALEMGFDGKLTIHPAQVAPVVQAFTPSEAEVAHALRIVEAAASGGVAVVDGRMVDPPVIAAARRILARATPS
ncbi:CoA ester lyase [bacterium]|nr:MAG: CoA ester lyase [bacterium]